MPEPASAKAPAGKPADLSAEAAALAAVKADATTWVPVAFFSFIEKKDADPELCQLWVTPLGQSEWRKVERRNIAEMTKAYVECQAYSENEPDADFTE